MVFKRVLQGCTGGSMLEYKIVNKIHKAVDDNKSMDTIVGMFVDRRTTNTDWVRKIVRNYKWKKRIKMGKNHDRI